MRQIGSIPSERKARLFEDYLLTQGVKAMVEEEANGWNVWIYDEDHVGEAKQELDRFLEKPDDPAYQNVNATAAELRKQEQQKQDKARKNRIDVRQRWSRPMAQSCPVTFAMIALSVIVAIATRLGDRHEPVENALSIASYRIQGNTIYWQGLDDIRHGQVWRLVTPIFLHFGILHILFNMLWLRDLGAAIEFRRGSLRFVLLVVAIAAASNLAEYYFNLSLSLRESPPINLAQRESPSFGGMSGVVFGLFGYIWMKSRYDPGLGFFLHPNTVFLMIAWLFLCMTGVVGAIANVAHGVGLVAGVVLGYVPILWKNLRR